MNKCLHYFRRIKDNCPYGSTNYCYFISLGNQVKDLIVNEFKRHIFFLQNFSFLNKN